MTARTAPSGPRMSVSASVPVGIATAWERFVPIRLQDVFPKAKGPIPPVIGVEGQTGRWDEPGRSRVVVLGGGARVTETITLSEPSGGAAPVNGRARFGYVVSGITSPLGHLAKEAHGFWEFRDGPGGTDIDWTYVLVPKSPFARPVLSVLVATFWRAYMRDGIRNVARDLGEGPSPGRAARIVADDAGAGVV